MRPPAIELGRDERRVQPRSDRGRLASGVPELDRNFLSLRVRKVDDLYGAYEPLVLETKHQTSDANLLERRDLLVLPETEIICRDAAFGGHGGILYKREAWPAREDATNYAEGGINSCASKRITT
jgi:hypothetical protein